MSESQAPKLVAPSLAMPFDLTWRTLSWPGQNCVEDDWQIDLCSLSNPNELFLECLTIFLRDP